MTRRGLRLPRLRRRWWVALGAVVAFVATLAVVGVARSDPAIRTRSQFLPGVAEAGHPVRLDTTLYLPAATPAPAVLLAHGLGGTKASVASEARRLARAGYVVLAYTARGFGASGGLIHLDSPSYEVADARGLVTWLAALPEVARSGGAPRIAVAGSSYGGGLALLLAGSDPRISAVAADITWNDLNTALFPNGASGPGVFKRMWAGLLFAAGGSPRLLPSSIDLPPSVSGTASACGRYAADVCAAYQYAARTGTLTGPMRSLLSRSSPASVLSRITAPTLLTQGEQDALFPLTEADANARGIAATGPPVGVVWRTGGHSGGGDVPTGAVIRFFDDVFAGRVQRNRPQPFELAEPGAAISAASGRTIDQVRRASGYPGVAGVAASSHAVPLGGPPQTVVAPAGGLPAAVTDVPGTGALSTVADLGVGGGLSLVPGQFAAFVSPPLTSRLLVAGPSTVRLRVTASSSSDATLFVALRDMAPDGATVLPASLVSPVRLTGLPRGVPTAVTVRLPAVVRDVASRHRLMLTVSTTDLGYALPVDARTYTVALDGAAVTVPTVSGVVLRSGHPGAWLVVGVLVALLVGLAVLVLLRRRRLAVRPAPELASVPIVVQDLVKAYGDGYRAVDGVSFRVEPGQVVGLLGPNGAGKTTTLRVLVGLITPTAGSVYVFGHPVLPGAPVLARLGAFIEGPGFLPHLTGRENLRLFWAATGRPEAEAQFDTALEIAGLGASIDRRVKTYSHGMSQRLGIAQAMLGLPEVLVLDEPTNGLDPPQIAEMREVMRAYAATGRTVIVSSHLLAEVEQTCSHVVVMHRGRLVAAGSVAEIAGAGAMQLAVPDPSAAVAALAAAGIPASAVPARRALEDVFLDLIGDDS